MRERVRGDLGIVVPGIQFESDLELPRRGYAILLQDFPVQMGVLPEGASYCYGDAARVEGAADGDAILLKQAHPVTGAPGAWIRDTALRGLTAAQIWRDPILFVVAELEAVLRRNAADFLVFDYIDGLIEDWALDDRAAQIVDEVLAAPAARVQFAWAARASIAEGVPLTDGPAILAGYRTGLFAGRGDDEILRQMRLAVLDKLPGRDENASRILLPADLEEELSEALAGADGDGVSLSPVRAFEIVGRIRQLLEAAQPRTALVTSSPHARPLLRRLICAEFPDVAVLSTEELDPETPMSSLAIEKDATPHSPVIEETADRV
jgi:flagellar biosynthesis component FlhA